MHKTFIPCQSDSDSSDNSNSLAIVTFLLLSSERASISSVQWKSAIYIFIYIYMCIS